MTPNRALLAAFAWVAGSSMARAESTGSVVRVDRAAPRHVLVPAGAFVMGLSSRNDDVSELRQSCETSFAQQELREFPLPGQNGTTSFCQLYARQLEAMADRIIGADGSLRERVVYLGAFAIDRYETTVAEYRACVDAGACSLDPLIAGDERYLSRELPIVNVTWYEAEAHCRWRGGRLPTEAEWERAARGADRRRWPWGNRNRTTHFNHGKARTAATRELDRLAWIGIPVPFLGDPDDVDGSSLIAAPGRYPWSEGPYGTRDQAGNVAEWTADSFAGISPALAIDEHNFGYNGLPSINPRRDGAPTDPRVVRGGSWRQPEFLGRANVRDPFNMLYVPTGRFSHIGFRCARTVRNDPS